MKKLLLCFLGWIALSLNITTVNARPSRITPAASSNANLSHLVISGTTLSPSFAVNTTSYTASVNNKTTSVKVTPTTADVNASVTVNGVPVVSGTASGAIALNVGPNTITTVVTAQDGVTTKTYTVTVTRAASNNDFLNTLALKPYFTLTQVAGPAHRNYTATVNNNTPSVQVVATTADPTATLTVNGAVVASGHPSAIIPLNYGANTITVVVTAQDGVSTNTSIITVTRPQSSNALLAALKLSNGAILAPAFASATTAYTSNVVNGISSITVTPTAADPTASIKVDGSLVRSGTASPSIPLIVGANVITIAVTAQDGVTTQTYTVTVTRAGPGAGGTYTWTGAGADNNWNDSNNWSPSSGYPIAGDAAIIGATANMPTVNTASACTSLTITGATTITLASNLNISGNFTINAALSVSGAAGTITAVSLDVNAGGSFTNARPFILNTGNLSLGNAAFINNSAGGTFNATTSPSINMQDNAYISNYGTFALSGAVVKLGKSGSINNGSTGVFTINGGSSIDFATNSASGASIQNLGTFHAGTSNSKCTINLNFTSATIQNSGSFYLGPLSVINLTGSSTSVGNTGTFTLQSDVNGCAIIGQITGNLAGCFGTFSVERFITGGASKYRGYRLLSSPVNAGMVNGNKVYSLNYVKLSSYVTGTTGTTGGFDNTGSGNPSLYLFRENITPSNATFTSGNYRGVNNITTSPNYSIDNDGSGFNIPVGDGFLFFFRGDRNVASFTAETNSSYVPTNTTLTSTGTLNQGQILVKDWYTPASSNMGFTNTAGNASVQGFNLVGNPYPSAINWDTYNTSSSTTGIYGPNLNPFIYVLDPVSKNYNIYSANTGGVGTIASSGSNIIPTGQGFYVVAANASAQLIFNESAKVNAQANAKNGNLFLGNPPVAAVNQYLKLKMLKDTVNVDGIMINFNSTAKPEFALNEDALYKPGFGAVSLSSMSADGIPLAVNTLALPKQTQTTIALNVNAETDGTYQLNLDAVKSVPELYDIWLVDAYKKDSVNLKQSSTYSFEIHKGDGGSFGQDRFSLVIRQNPALMMHLLNFTAAKSANSAQVVWKTENEQNYTYFTVERSTNNGQTFSVIGSVPSAALGSYSYLDKAPLLGANLYRLKIEDINGSISYSNVVTIMYGASNTITLNGFNLYPNPTAGSLSLAITNQSAANAPAAVKPVYNIEIVNSTGAVVKTAQSSSLVWSSDVSQFLPGTYIVRVINSANNSLVGKSTFVKL